MGYGSFSILSMCCAENAPVVYGLTVEHMEIMECTLRRMSVAESPRDSSG